METDGHVEKQSTVFPHVLAKRLGAFCTVPTGFTAVNPQTTKPDISICYRHIPTFHSDIPNVSPKWVRPGYLVTINWTTDPSVKRPPYSEIPLFSEYNMPA